MRNLWDVNYDLWSVEMPSNQFAELPPFELVTDFFNKVTGLHCFKNEATWISWKELDEVEIAQFEPYIRPCHRVLIRRLLNTKPGEVGDPLPFLRQLIRPFGWVIDIERIMVEKLFYRRFVLREKKDELTLPERQEPSKVNWVV